MDKMRKEEPITIIVRGNITSEDIFLEARRMGIKAASESKFLRHYAVNYEKVLKKGLSSIHDTGDLWLSKLRESGEDSWARRSSVFRCKTHE